MLTVRGLNQYYGESHTLWDIDLELPKGACVCVIGRNGVGKTTLLRAVMGLVPAASGSIRLADTELRGRPAELRARLGIGYVPQGREIFPQLSVEENLRIGLRARGARVIPERVFELFPVLETMRRRRGGDLSGGQQQQLALARALVLQPTLLILDEPTEGIQPSIVQMIGDVLEALCAEDNLSVLLVEQKLPFARRLAQHFCLMDRGRTVASGPMDGLDNELIQQYLHV